jgi:hypothetical protein
VDVALGHGRIGRGRNRCRAGTCGPRDRKVVG